MIARSRGPLVLLACAAALTVAPRAAAQEQPGYAANHIDMSERGSRWFVLDSVDIQGKGRLALGVVNDLSYRPLVHYNADGNVLGSLIRNQYVMHLGGSVVLADRIRVGVGVPVQVYGDGKVTVIRGVVHRGADGAAVGDVRLAVDGRLVGEPGGLATLAAGVALFVPSGSTAAYTGDGKPRVEPRVAFAGQTSSFAYAAKLGVLFRGRDEAFADGYIGHSVTGAVSGGALLAGGRLLVGPELFGSAVVSGGDASGSRTTPVEALLGAHFDAGSNIRLGLAGGAGLTRSYGAPVARGLLSVEWVPGDAKAVVVDPSDDRDGDGIADCVDACSYVYGVASADESKNGCPLDSDNDSVEDTVDACRDEPGIASRDPRANGCPQDTDRDGVPDSTDACAQEPGKRTLDPKTSGCPERDKDGDHVLDAADACPDKAGPANTDPKKNGCPLDLDRDRDGFPNDKDACPDEPGKSDPDPKKNGCPKAFLKGDTIQIVEQVRFKANGAEIDDTASDDVLDAVLTILKAHPELKSLRVEGHTDNRGNPARNKKLSLARAEAVTKWLETHGIDKQRLTAEGLGAARPLNTNETEVGRTNNRRVEFHVIQRSEK